MPLPSNVTDPTSHPASPLLWEAQGELAVVPSPVVTLERGCPVHSGKVTSPPQQRGDDVPCAPAGLCPPTAPPLTVLTSTLATQANWFMDNINYHVAH